LPVSVDDGGQRVQKVETGVLVQAVCERVQCPGEWGPPTLRGIGSGSGEQFLKTGKGVGVDGVGSGSEPVGQRHRRVAHQGVAQRLGLVQTALVFGASALFLLLRAFMALRGVLGVGAGSEVNVGPEEPDRGRGQFNGLTQKSVDACGSRHGVGGGEGISDVACGCQNVVGGGCVGAVMGAR
jgi:hypothetical protein